MNSKSGTPCGDDVTYTEKEHRDCVYPFRTLLYKQVSSVESIILSCLDYSLEDDC
jgi:hypothetical protein